MAFYSDYSDDDVGDSSAGPQDDASPVLAQASADATWGGDGAPFPGAAGPGVGSWTSSGQSAGGYGNWDTLGFYPPDLYSNVLLNSPASAFPLSDIGLNGGASSNPSGPAPALDDDGDAGSATQPTGSGAGSAVSSGRSESQSKQVATPDASPSNPTGHSQPQQYPPGYEPKVLTGRDGKPIRSFDGKPILMPSNLDLASVAWDGRWYSDHGFFNGYENLPNFGTGKEWDTQRINGKFYPEYRDIATVRIGVYGASAGMPIGRLLSIQDAYAARNSHFRKGEPMDSVYKHLPARNVYNTRLGYSLVQSGQVKPNY